MASIKAIKDKNGKIISYRVQIRRKGCAPQSSNHERLTDAKKWAQDIESAIRQGRHFKTTESKKHTLAELIDRYIRDVLPTKPKSEKKQRAQLLWWKAQIGHKLLSDVTTPLLIEQRDKFGRSFVKGGRVRSPSTVVRYLAALSHAFTIAVKEWGWLENSPMQNVTKPREPRGRVRFLSSEERQRLLAACQESSNRFLYPVVVLALSSGMRQGEIMNLRWVDVDLDKGRATLHETKNGERRVVPVVGLALKLLRDLDKVRRIDSMFVFPSRDPRKPADLRSPWKRALKVSGIECFRFHDCRHSCASELAMNGASLVDIKNLLGHKQISVTSRYSHLTEDHTANVVSSMNDKIFG
ncbi:MAG: site-specific integrase [Chlamydiales bacterium]|nr:site-specific integrase [Chlamydiales bacterium]